jgi:hypothetical protein
MSDDKEEIQKALAEMNQRVADFQQDGSTVCLPNSAGLSSKLILAGLGLILVLALSAYIYMKSLREVKIQPKAPPGFKVIYPQDGPPRLEPKV